jgi:DNA-binding NarL/FixJ family response regulator
LSIQVFFGNLLEKKEIDFFGTSEWTIESEKQFISKVQELFGMVRDHASNVDLQFNIETKDISHLSFILNKKKNKNIEINTAKLTLREIEVLGLIMQGLTNNMIAQKLFISYETVKTHRKNILDKTGSKNTACLINYYHQTFFEK